MKKVIRPILLKLNNGGVIWLPGLKESAQINSDSTKNLIRKQRDKKFFPGK